MHLIVFRHRAMLAASFAAVLVSCSRGGSAPAIPEAALPASKQAPAVLDARPIGNARPVLAPLAPVRLAPGAVTGRDRFFTPEDGDMQTGGRGRAMAGIPCAPREQPGQYHVHAYLGLLYYGLQVAIPDVIGMLDPKGAHDGFTYGARCFYYLHTHDASGTVHVEVPVNRPPGAVLYKLGAFLSIWGVSVGPDHFGPFAGDVRAYVGRSQLGQMRVSSYREYRGDIRSIPLASHEAIWITVGSPSYGASRLPPVSFYTEY